MMKREEQRDRSTKRSFALRSAAFAFLCVLTSAGLYACEKKGPLESAGEQVDESINDAKRAVEDAAD